MNRPKVFVLGGDQTDLSYNWSRHGHGLYDIFKAGAESAFEAAGVEPKEVDVCHVANFSSELFCGQGQLGGFFASLHPDLAGVPASRHEAACAAGSAATLAAWAELEAGRYEVACVIGAEQMRNVPGERAAEIIGTCAWSGREAQEAKYVWPHMFGLLEDEYERRYGLDRKHLARIGEINFSNAKRNPKAQTRGWSFAPGAFTESDADNPVVEGRLRRHDCSQITDGAAAVFLASERFATQWAARRGISLDRVPVLKGFGHRTAPMLFEDKMAISKDRPYVFPEVRRTIQDAFRRAEVSLDDIDAIETHDCFTITEYMAIDHFGLTAPGRSFEAVESGAIELGGKLPVNPSGGLMGVGHPIGATGVRMVLDAWRQVTGRAGDYQVPKAKNVATLNIGGSATSSISLVIGV